MNRVPKRVVAEAGFVALAWLLAAIAYLLGHTRPQDLFSWLASLS